MNNLRETVDTARANRRIPRVHPNGFLQLDLNDDKSLRLHIWDHELPRQKTPTPIHDHEFALKSSVLLGCLVNKRFRVTQDANGDYKKWSVKRQAGSENTTLIPSSDTFTVAQITRELIRPGDVYTMVATEFHESGHVGRTASIMQKLGYQAGHSASVLVPIDKKPDNEFDRELFDIDQLWDVVYETITRTE